MSQCHDEYQLAEAGRDEKHLVRVHLIHDGVMIKATATMTEGLVHLTGYGVTAHSAYQDHAGSAIADSLTALASRLRSLG